MGRLDKENIKIWIANKAISRMVANNIERNFFKTHKAASMNIIENVSYRVLVFSDGSMSITKWVGGKSAPVTVGPERKWVEDKVAVLRLLKVGEDIPGVGNKIAGDIYWVYTPRE